MSDNSIASINIRSGEQVAMGAIEITSVPSVSIIDATPNALPQILDRYKHECADLLNEVYQIYKASGFTRNLALELLWMTHPVENQPFRAAIRLFLIARAIGSAGGDAAQTVAHMLRLCQSTFSLQKYDLSQIAAEDLLGVIEGIDNSQTCALVKEESVENLQNQLLPYCYSFGRIQPSDSDLSRVVSSLTDAPHCAVSFQLMPAAFTPAESAEIDRTTQALGTLTQGVADQGLGHVSFALAEKHAVHYRYYADHKNAPLFSFNILIHGSEEALTNLSSKLSSQFAAGTNLKTVRLDLQGKRNGPRYYSLPWVAHQTLLNQSRNPRIWSTKLFASFYRLPYLITSEEASEFFRLPVGSDRVSAGLVVNEAAKDARTYTDNIINAGDITVGRLRASARGDTIGFALKDLAKHMLVVGTPGSGKTTFSVSLLDRLWKQHGIPFLVIEPAKNEYRALVKSIPDLQVFTPGKNFISPFVFNPFIPPKNVKLETYKSTLKTAFSAAVSMTTPLDKIFEESINNCYSDFRWLDTYTSDDRGQVFNISDFIKCFQQTFDEIGYTGDAKNIGRAGVVRLNSLVNLFDHYASIPIEDLLSKPTIIELAAIENSDEKALIIALLLLSILAYVNANYVGEGGLKNVILLEEAHVLFDAGSGGQSETNPAAIAQGLVKRMLAEIRSYGVGLVIADQSPRKVTTDVVALTDMKMVFRLVESEDKQIIADSTNMTPAQTQRMAKLRPGEAFLFFNKLEEPEEVVTPDYRLENNIDITLSDSSIRSLSTYWLGRAQQLRPYPQCALCRCCTESCDYNRRILAREIARRIFVKHFRADSKDFQLVVEVFKNIRKLTVEQLNGEAFSPELLLCVKVHLWRRIRYGTKINVRDIQIENSLKK